MIPEEQEPQDFPRGTIIYIPIISIVKFIINLFKRKKEITHG